jgi:hypothetical protein
MRQHGLATPHRGEKFEKLGVDPYSRDVPPTFTPPKEDKGWQGRRLDSLIEQLEQDARIREGLDYAECRDARNFRVLSRKQRTLELILRAQELLRVHHPDIYEDRGLRLLSLAIIVPGRIR